MPADSASPNSRASPKPPEPGAERMKRFLAILGLTLPLLFPVGASADQYCQLRGRPVASVLVIHGGAWYGGFAGASSDLCAELAALGYRARSLEYPLRRASASFEYALAAAAQEARRGRPVYAVGTSAGGTIAEYLAVRRQVDGALAVAPLSNLVEWRGLRPGFWEGLGMTLELRRRWSPYHNLGRSVPLQIIHSRHDEVVPYEQSVQMVRRCGSPCDLITLRHGGGHVLSLVWQTPAAVRWFLARARRPLQRASTTAEARRDAGVRRAPRGWQR